MIVATAGHVDHGKTTLIRALTGVDTDRLAEEKRRGMTIDLGFAYLPVPSSGDSIAEPIAFIDVPGHQRFIRNMLCGVGGADFVLLVVAADDGPMPQTGEHLAILDLLDIRMGAVALTKIDRVSAERLCAVRGEVAALLAGTSLAAAPLFEVAASRGTGVDVLKNHLMTTAGTFRPGPAAGNFRLAVDRSFSLSGTGLVVTGTVFSGSLSTGDMVRVLGMGVSARARSIHAQNKQVARGRAGQRCAINLAGIGLKSAAIERGEWIVVADVPETQPKFDARLRIVHGEAKPFRHWTPVHIHLGATDVTGRIAVLEGKAIEPGQSALVQLVPDRPVGALHGDRFIVRDQSAQRTIGGGRVIDIFPPVRGRSKPERLANLAAMEVTAPNAALTALLELGVGGVNLARFQANRNLTQEEATSLFDTVAMVRIATPSGPLGFAMARWSVLRSSVLTRLAGWHERMPGTIGLAVDRLLQGSDFRLPRETVVAIATELGRQGAIVRSGAGVRLPSHRPRLDTDDEILWQRIEPLLAACPMRPPSLSEICYVIEGGVKRIEIVLGRAVHCGRAIRVSPKRYFLPAPLLALADIMHTLAAENASSMVSAAEFRDRSVIGRNVSIEVLEFFDKVKFTRRLGAGRIVNCAPREIFSGNIK